MPLRGADDEDPTRGGAGAAMAESSRGNSLLLGCLPSVGGASAGGFLSKNSRSSSSSATGAMAPRSIRSQFSRNRGIQYEDAMLATMMPKITAKHTLLDTLSQPANTSFNPIKMRMA